MTDELVAQIRRYTFANLDPSAETSLDIEQLTAPSRRHRIGRWRVAALVAVVLIVVAAATTVAVHRSPDATRPRPHVASPSSGAEPTLWSPIGSPGEMQAFALAVSAKGYVAGGSTMSFSRDGITWRTPSIDNFGNALDVIATPTGFMAVGTSVDKHAAIWTSSDGLTWRASRDSALEPWTPPIPDGVSTTYGSANAAARTPLGYVVVGSVFDGSFVDGTLMGPPWKPAIWVSADGTHWARHDADGWVRGTQLVGITTIGSEVYVFGTDQGTSTIWSSSDLTRWRPTATLPGTSINRIAELDGHLIAVGTAQAGDVNQRLPTIWRAETPSTWKIVYQGAAAPLNDLTRVVANGRYALALGYTGASEVDPATLLLYSADGTTWQPTTTRSCAPSPSCLQPAIAAGYPTAAAARGSRFYAGFASIAPPHAGDPANQVRRRLTVYRSPSAEGLDPTARAAWALDNPRRLGANTRTFTAAVTRVACSSGTTDPVHDPTIRYGRATITITFTVDPLPPGGYTCQGGRPTPYRVHLTQPIKKRKLVDGVCIRDPDLATTAICSPTSQRWPIPRSAAG